MPKIKALILDLDLTLAENLERKRKAVERGLGRLLSDDQWYAIKGEYDLDKALEVLEASSKRGETSEKVMKHFLYDGDLFDYDRPFKGAVETIQRLAEKGYKIYYLTGRPIHQTAVRFVTKHGFPEGKVFSAKVGLGESEKKVALMSKIVDEAGLKPQEVVAVGDLPGDGLAAKKAGVHAIGTCEYHKYLRKELSKICDYVIDSITELPSILERLEAESS